jgi:YggT family protein
MNAFFNILADIVVVYLVVMIAYALCSWLPREPGSVITRIYGLLGALCDPVLRPVRRLIPPIRTGGAAIDLSVLIVVLGLGVLISVLRVA